VGKPYVWGAEGPDTYDCSGLMQWAYNIAGINLPRVSRDQFNAGGHVPVREAQPGDLMFYATDRSDPTTIHHVFLYMGDGQMVEAPYSGQNVRVQKVSWDYRELVPLATRPGTTPNTA
jgi:cell wall-associated NlpC family hydrolase